MSQMRKIYVHVYEDGFHDYSYGRPETLIGAQLYRVRVSADILTEIIAETTGQHRLSSHRKAAWRRLIRCAQSIEAVEPA